MDVIFYILVGGHSGLETGNLITAAGQRRIFTELSPLYLVADPYQNRLRFRILTHLWHLWEAG